MEKEANISVYRAARTIKRRQNTLYNVLISIYEDSIFVGEISQLWPQLPLLANLRCGLWYSSKFHSTCYFKSTDGHTHNWSFNTSRLNLHVALLAGQKGGCMLVDSTRKGKRFPDSMSKTIPIWTCVLNRSVYNYRKKRCEGFLLVEGVSIGNVLTLSIFNYFLLSRIMCKLCYLAAVLIVSTIHSLGNVSSNIKQYF